MQSQRGYDIFRVPYYKIRKECKMNLIKIYGINFRTDKRKERDNKKNRSYATRKPQNNSENQLEKYPVWRSESLFDVKA